jgi:hypothetical protein
MCVCTQLYFTPVIHPVIPSVWCFWLFPLGFQEGPGGCYKGGFSQGFRTICGFCANFYLNLVRPAWVQLICWDEQFDMKIIPIIRRLNRFDRFLRFGFGEGVDFLGWREGGQSRWGTYENRNGIRFQLKLIPSSFLSGLDFEGGVRFLFILTISFLTSVELSISYYRKNAD